MSFHRSIRTTPEGLRAVLCRCFLFFVLTAFLLACVLVQECREGSSGSAMAEEESAKPMDYPEEEKDLVVMPGLKTMTAEAASAALKDLGITQWTIVPVPSKAALDTVIEQNPAPGNRVRAEHVRITLYIAAQPANAAPDAPKKDQVPGREKRKSSAFIAWAVFLCSQMLIATMAVSLLKKSAPLKISSDEVKITLTPRRKQAKKRLLALLQSNIEQHQAAMSPRRRKQEKERAHAANHLTEGTGALPVEGRETGEEPCPSFELEDELSDDSAPFPCMPATGYPGRRGIQPVYEGEPDNEQLTTRELCSGTTAQKAGSRWHSELSQELREEDREMVEQKTTDLLRHFARKLETLETLEPPNP